MNNTFYKENNLSGLKRADFQKIVDGKETDLFILSNQQGAEVAITNYGGAIYRTKTVNWPMWCRDMTVSTT